MTNPNELPTLIKIPGEDEQTAAVHDALKQEFATAIDAFNFWVKTPKNAFLSASSLPESTLHLAMALNTNACRQFRSVIRECMCCEAVSAAVLARCQFETCLALIFILKPEVYLALKAQEKNGNLKRNEDGSVKYVIHRPLKKTPRISQNLLSRKFRTYLYLAHDALSQMRLTDRIQKTPGFESVGRQRHASTDPELSQILQENIGSEWLGILNESKSYSGLNIADTADLLDVKWWYCTVYSDQSRIVHGTDALQNCNLLDSGVIAPRFISALADVERALSAGTTMFLAVANAMQEYIGFGEEAKNKLQVFIETHRVE